MKKAVAEQVREFREHGTLRASAWRVWEVVGANASENEPITIREIRAKAAYHEQTIRDACAILEVVGKIERRVVRRSTEQIGKGTLSKAVVAFVARQG